MGRSTQALLIAAAAVTASCGAVSMNDEAGAKLSELASGTGGTGAPGIISCSTGDPNAIVLRNGAQVPGLVPPTVYAGTTDTYIDKNNPAVNYGSALDLIAKKDKAILLRFDLSSIPPGARLACAMLEWTVQDPSVRTFQAFEMKKPWLPGAATWSSYGPGLSWESPGALGPADSGSGIVAQVFGATRETLRRELSVTLVQAWVDDPSRNHGLIIMNANANDGLNIIPSEFTQPDARPALVVSYPH